MLFICIAFSIIVPYLICSINPAIIVTKIKSGEDIRSLGSGGAGLTNTLRTQGKTAAVIVLLGDVLKGVAAILLIKLFCSLLLPAYSVLDIDPPIEYAGYFPYLCMWLGSLSAVLGHCFPLYYKFKGGKAVLITVTTGMVINWLPPLIAFFIFIIIVAVTRYVSLGSIIAAVCYPVCVWVVGVFVWGIPYTHIGVIFTSIISVILIFMHKKNIVRLINKNEKKLGQSERKKKNG
ncbi:MAG: glycerol-3-phosphate 1-O-acyltransferase PlsY [Oscillospiraceae bacterium]|jgi:glycerol-3-phosphate acyltransferase PlsY|nr:glycerol-3-phosphate 1-O-acyltransferase PlsY [Oscillospiraceae bacterium]